MAGREQIVHRNLLLSVSFLPCEREEDIGSAHSESDAAAHGHVLCTDIMEDSDVRTANWLMQADNDGVQPEVDKDSQGSDVSKSDSLKVNMSRQASHPAPDQDAAHSTVNSVEDSPHCSVAPHTHLPCDGIPTDFPRL